MVKSALLAGACYSIAVLLGIALSRGVSHKSFFETAGTKGDNSEYLALTRAMLHRNLDDPALERSKRLYPGTPFAAATMSRVTGLDPSVALPVVCWIALAGAWFFACRLYGPMAGALIVCIDYSVVERSLYGGPEAPVLCLCLLGLWLARRGSPAGSYASALVLALAVCVKPIALTFLAGLWLAILMRRAFRELAVAVSIPALIFGAVFWSLHTSGMATDPINGYRSDWNGSFPFSFPLWPMMGAIVRYEETLGSLAKSLAYVFFVAGAVWIFCRNWRGLLREFPVDALGFVFSVGFIFCYNSPGALSEFQRHSLLCLPFACYLIWQFLSERFRVSVWNVAIFLFAVATFSSFSTYNVGQSLRFLLHALDG